MDSVPLRAAIYARVSQDPTQRWRSVGEQETECRAFADRMGWTVAEVFVDNDRSASRYAKRTRPAFDELQAFIAAGGCDVVLTWEGSRGQRDLEVFVQVRNLLERHGVLWSYDGDVLDMRNARDRKRAAEDAIDAEYEVDRTRERILRSTRAQAAAGRPHGRVLYGYRRVYDQETRALLGQEPHPAEAPIVRKVFSDYLAGIATQAIVDDLNEITGKQPAWTSERVHQMLSNPSYVARRKHQGAVVGDADWPALVSAEVFDRVQARRAEQRWVPSGARAHRTHLLTTVLRCGVCGDKMRASTAGKPPARIYTCKSACTGRRADPIDAFVTTIVIERLARPDVADLLGDSTPAPRVLEARSTIDELRRRIADAAAEYTAGRLTAATLARVESGLLEQISEAEAIVRRDVIPLHIDPPSADPAAWWDALEAEQRREVVAAFIDHVIVHRVGKGNRRHFDPSTLEIAWRRS